VKLRQKILIGYGFVLTLIVTVCALAVVSLHQLGQASQAILQENYRSILAAQNMIEAIDRQDSATLLQLLDDNSEGQKQFQEYEVEFLQWLGRAKDNITIIGEEQLITSLEAQYQDYLAAFSQLREWQLTPASKLSTDYYHQTVQPQFQSVRDRCIELRRLNQQIMEAASIRAESVSTRAIGQCF
jgi:NtrC-family two-component system sensor histidine kinase KinB